MAGGLLYKIGGQEGWKEKGVKVYLVMGLYADGDDGRDEVKTTNQRIKDKDQKETLMH
jgi:hypothetical protein